MSARLRQSCEGQIILTAINDNEQRKTFLVLDEMAHDQQKVVDEMSMLSEALYRANRLSSIGESALCEDKLNDFPVSYNG